MILSRKKDKEEREREKESTPARAKNSKMRDVSTYQALRPHTTCSRSQVSAKHLVSLRTLTILVRRDEEMESWTSYWLFHAITAPHLAYVLLINYAFIILHLLLIHSFPYLIAFTFHKSQSNYTWTLKFS